MKNQRITTDIHPNKFGIRSNYTKEFNFNKTRLHSMHNQNYFKLFFQCNNLKLNFLLHLLYGSLVKLDRNSFYLDYLFDCIEPLLLETFEDVDSLLLVYQDWDN